jgi:hypothetical protein
MTPKEKAQELVNKYSMNTPMGFHIDDAKECALIAVGEILQNLNKISKDLLSCDYQPYSHLIYWQEVKTEIEKL